MQAAQISLAHGKARYTQQILDAYVAVGDAVGFKRDFGKILSSPAGANSYPALTNYGMGLAHFSDPEAPGAFKRAIASSPDNKVWAVNEYARYLMGSNQPTKAAGIIESNTDVNLRARAITPSFLLQQARRKAGLDTSNVDQEVAVLSDLLTRLGFGTVSSDAASVASSQRSAAAVTALSTTTRHNGSVAKNTTSIATSTFFGKIGSAFSAVARGLTRAFAAADVAPANAASPTATPTPFAHTNFSDDCRVGYTQTTALTFTDDGKQFTWPPVTINLAEVEYNERGPENNLPWGAVDAVGWTVRDRAYENVCGAANDNECNSPSVGFGFYGGCYYRNNKNPDGLTCSALPYSDCESKDQNGNCLGIDPISKWYCCAEHGGAVTYGEGQYQIDDDHVDPTLLLDNGYLAAAVYLQYPFVPDMSRPNGDGTYYVDPRVLNLENKGNCVFSCTTPICYVPSRITQGQDFTGPLPSPSSSIGWLDGASPFGPLEFMSKPAGWYNPSKAACEHQPYDMAWGWGNVCNGGNYFASNQISLVPHPQFFAGEVSLASGFYYLAFGTSNPFGYYAYQTNGISWTNWIWHDDMDWEWVQVAANDPLSGVWLWDSLEGWLYTNSLDFPYLWNSTHQHWWWYEPAGIGNGLVYTNNPRWFADVSAKPPAWCYDYPNTQQPGNCGGPGPNGGAGSAPNGGGAP